MKKFVVLIVIFFIFSCKNDIKYDIKPTENKPIENKPVAAKMFDSYQVGKMWIYRYGQDTGDTTGKNPIRWIDAWTDTVFCVHDTIMNNRRWAMFRNVGYFATQKWIYALSDSAGFLFEYSRNLDKDEDYKKPHHKFMNCNRWRSAYFPEYVANKNIGDTLWITENRVFWYGYLHENEPVSTPAGLFNCKMYGLCMTQMSGMRTQHSNCMEKNYYSEKVGLVLYIGNHFGLNNYRELVYYGDVK